MTTATWKDIETYKLIELWSDETIQEQLEGCKKNKDIYDKLSREMEKCWYIKSGSQCRDKIKKLKGEYRKIRDHNNITGRNRKLRNFMKL